MVRFLLWSSAQGIGVATAASNRARRGATLAACCAMNRRLSTGNTLAKHRGTVVFLLLLPVNCTVALLPKTLVQHGCIELPFLCDSTVVALLPISLWQIGLCIATEGGQTEKIMIYVFSAKIADKEAFAQLF